MMDVYTRSLPPGYIRVGLPLAALQFRATTKAVSSSTGAIPHFNITYHISPRTNTSPAHPTMSFFTTTTANASSAFSLFAQPQDPREAYENSRALGSIVGPAPTSTASQNAYLSAYSRGRSNEHPYTGFQPCTRCFGSSNTSRTKSGALLGGFRRIMTMGGKSSSGSTPASTGYP